MLIASNAARTGPRSTFFFWLQGLVLVAATLVVQPTYGHAVATAGTVTTVAGLDQATALDASQAVLDRSISDFTLLDRAGQPVRLAQYRGKPLLVSFIYTGCFDVCPATTRALQNAVEASRNVFGTHQFNVLSIGFNQPADSPQAMKAFALQYRIDQPNWEFLSPHASIVESLTREFGFSYAATPAGFDHILQVTLLDGTGRIYRQIYGDSFGADGLAEPLKQLLSNTPVAQQLSLEGLLDRVRILCTVYDPKSGTYRVQYGLLIEVAGGVTFALAVVWFFLAEWRTQRRARRRPNQHLSPADQAHA